MKRSTYLNRICANCGGTYGSHHGGTSPWPRDYCPGTPSRMDWENGPGTTFKEKQMRIPLILTRKSPVNKSTATIGNLKYGTVFEYNGSIYSKMNKRSSGQGVRICYSVNHCCAYNPKHGTVRELPGNTKVKVLDAELMFDVTADAVAYTKNYC